MAEVSASIWAAAVAARVQALTWQPLQAGVHALRWQQLLAGVHGLRWEPLLAGAQVEPHPQLAQPPKLARALLPSGKRLGCVTTWRCMARHSQC